MNTNRTEVVNDRMQEMSRTNLVQKKVGDQQIGCFHLLMASLLCIGLWTSTAYSQQGGVPLQPEQKVSSMPTREAGGKTSGVADNIDSADLQTEHATARSEDLPALVPSGRPAIGLALEGGGALGLAHIGVLQWLEEHHVPVDRIAGTSMGALVGGLYATGHSVAQIKEIASGKSLDGIFVLSQSYSDLSFRRREDQVDLPQAILLGMKGGPSVRNALVEDVGLNNLLRKKFDRYNLSALSFDRLPIPFRCVATDLNTMEPVVFRGGPMPQAIRASISIPGVFSPVSYRGHYFVDGAIMDNLPTDIVKEDLHADVVIAVHLNSAKFAEGDVSSMVSVFARAYAAGTAKNERAAKALADILIIAETGQFTTSQYDKATDLILAGYAAAEAQKARLIPYALTDAQWKAYIADRESRILPPLPALRIVKVEGADPQTQAETRHEVSGLIGKPVDTENVAKALRGIQGNGGYGVSFESYAPTDGLAAKNENAHEPAAGLLVKLSDARNGPPYLLFGPDITATTSNVTRTTFDLRLYDPNLGGFGSELRANVRVGFLTQVSTEYYRLLTSSGFFIQPRIGVTRQPVYLWERQKRVSEHLQQQAGGGMEAGKTFSRNMQASLRWNADVVRWHLVSGSDGTPGVSGVSQTATAHFMYDSTTSGLLSPGGYRIETSVGALFNSSGSQNAPLVRFSAMTSKSVASGIVAGSVEANSYLRKNVAEPLRFTMGGPLRLSASSIDEYRGTDDFLVRVGYLYRIAKLPTGIGEGLYASIGYEGSEIWSPERPAMLRQDGVFTWIAATPIGVIKFGGSVGDAGRRKIFFSFGKLF